MSTTIEVARIRATLDGWVWTSENETLGELLNSMLNPAGPSGSDPDPEYHAARAAAEALGGKMVSTEPPEYEDPSLVY